MGDYTSYARQLPPTDNELAERSEKAFTRSFKVGDRVRYRRTKHIGTVVDTSPRAKVDILVLWDDFSEATGHFLSRLELLPTANTTNPGVILRPSFAPTGTPYRAP